ncbi:MAG: hypothetical protein IT383_12245 [Deltaproteobacteria bacterium]|nr:hypothetical protein [Deltaproteobacteria bacterium]
MALPPEPLDELLPAARTVVEAEVAAVHDLEPWPPGDKGAPIDGAPPRPSQRATLRVSRVLRGTADQELTVTKPAAGYALHAGVCGPFLVDERGHILGRYGPDTWAIEEIEAALRGTP